MRWTAGRATMAGLFFVVSVARAGAQTTAPPASPSPAAPAAAAPAPDRGVTVHAFVSASYVYNFNRPPSGANGLRVFDGSHDAPRIDVVELAFERAAAHPRDFGFRVDFEAGWSIPRVEAAAGLFRDVHTGKAENVDLQQAFLSYVMPAGSGLRFDIGKFVTPIGLEVVEGWDGYNDNASRSLLFGLSEPLTHTGVKASYSFTPKLSAAMMLVQGWDNVRDNNTGKSVAGSMTVTPNDAVTVIVNAITGPEQNGNARDRRTVVDLVATWKATDATTLGVNIDDGREANAALSGGPASWWGAALYLRHRFTTRFAWAVRGEFFSDPDGARTGAVQRLYQFTVTPELRWSSHLLVRGDLRFDRSSQPVFDARAGATRLQPTAGVNVIVH